jgi:hypothetical protein
MDIFLVGQNILISTYGFQGLSNASHYPVPLLTFIYSSLNYLLILNLLTETLLRIPFFVIGQCPLAPTSYIQASGKMRKN